MPWLRMDAASSSRESCEIVLRGCLTFGLTLDMGTRTVIPSFFRSPFPGVIFPGMRALSPLPKPLFIIAQILDY